MRKWLRLASDGTGTITVPSSHTSTMNNKNKNETNLHSVPIPVEIQFNQSFNENYVLLDAFLSYMRVRKISFIHSFVLCIAA